MTDEREYVTIQQAAAHFGVHEATIRRWIDRGDLQAMKIGPRLIRIPLSAITALAEKASNA